MVPGDFWSVLYGRSLHDQSEIDFSYRLFGAEADESEPSLAPVLRDSALYPKFRRSSQTGFDGVWNDFDLSPHKKSLRSPAFWISWTASRVEISLPCLLLICASKLGLDV